MLDFSVLKYYSKFAKYTKLQLTLHQKISTNRITDKCFGKIHKNDHCNSQYVFTGDWCW